ncbi:MAG: 2-C-methyl-D-erythritol 4-phosphate cytidylyltransferase [Desulfobacterales bacterium]|nr:2-C-methyl-D-erythritol 4-phosphate cytidylyltransferase [Desulfobacterales bacterium]
MNFAIIVAAGKGVRMNRPTRKQYLSIAGRPVLAHTLKAFDAPRLIDAIHLVVPGADVDYCRETIVSPLDLRVPVKLVSGGAERQESVYNGLLAVKTLSRGPRDVAAIHDGVRPLVESERLAACIAEAENTGACILGAPAVDTLKRVDSSGVIETTLERETIWMAHTPQAFHLDLILEAHEKARRDGWLGTDDASLVERLGKPVKIIPGGRANLKITTPHDLAAARALLQAKQGR